MQLLPISMVTYLSCLSSYAYDFSHYRNKSSEMKSGDVDQRCMTYTNPFSNQITYWTNGEFSSGVN